VQSVWSTGGPWGPWPSRQPPVTSPPAMLTT
jgi:hypothetical protein